MRKKKIKFFKYEFELTLKRINSHKVDNITIPNGAKLNIGPGPNWIKPDNSWYNVDIDPRYGDIIVDFQKFEQLPITNNSVTCVYGSHVFEHMSIFKSQLFFNEIYRVLIEGGVLRIILPDVEKSILEYVNKNGEFELFKRRKDRAKIRYDKDYTLFECMKEDFLSPSGQEDLLGKKSLAHQNAWDFETICSDLQIAGFSKFKIYKMDFKTSQTDYFSFEGNFISEANEDYRSLYVEAIK